MNIWHNDAKLQEYSNSSLILQWPVFFIGARLLRNCTSAPRTAEIWINNKYGCVRNLMGPLISRETCRGKLRVTRSKKYTQFHLFSASPLPRFLGRFLVYISHKNFFLFYENLSYISVCTEAWTVPKQYTCSQLALQRWKVFALYGFSPYRAVNTLHLGYKIQSVNVV